MKIEEITHKATQMAGLMTDEIEVASLPASKNEKP
jgi:hypothetical protein